jgi:hypothetical protein
MTRNPLIFFFLLFALTACSAADAQPTHAAFTLTPSPSASPTATRTVSAPGVTPTLIAREITEVALWGKGSANVIAHSPDGTHYAVGGSQGVHIFTIDDQEEAYLLDQDYVVRLLYSPNGRYLGAETFGGAKVVDLADNETVLDVDGYAIQSMSFSYINKLLAYFTGCYARGMPKYHFRAFPFIRRSPADDTLSGGHPDKRILANSLFNNGRQHRRRWK